MARTPIPQSVFEQGITLALDRIARLDLDSMPMAAERGRLICGAFARLRAGEYAADAIADILTAWAAVEVLTINTRPDANKLAKFCARIQEQLEDEAEVMR